MQRITILLIVVLASLSSAEKGGWSAAFLAGDGNRDGQLDRNELDGMVSALNPLKNSSKQVDRLLRLFDRNGDGQLSVEEVGADLTNIPANPQPEGLRILRDIPYRGGESKANGLQMLDCYVPAGASKAPVLVFIHGGGWCIGDKSRMDEKLNWWCGQGGIAVSVNYRLSPSVQHPAHIDDVAAAVAWVLDHIAEQGGDPQRVFVMGHSAGAHLAALVGADERRLAAYQHRPSELAGIILLDGAGYLITERMQGVDPEERVAKMYTAAFTADPAVQADASPALRIAEASAPPPPYCLTFSSLRRDAREQVAALQKAAEGAGGQAVSKGFVKSHMHMNADVGVKGDALTKFIQAFIDRTINE